MDDLDPKLQTILNQIQNFGFQFYGYDETGRPLVKGPNEQVVEINIAIDFVNRQIKSQRESASTGGSPEAMNMPENIDTSTKVETAVETKIETALESEKQQDNKPQQKPVQDDLTVKPKAPPIQLNELKVKPFGDGFDPVSFNPSDINSTLKFIEKNSKSSHTSSNKWLAEQFKKFIAEFRATQ